VNVRETALRERIDPVLSSGLLSEIASQALRRQVRVASWEVLTGGCWNRVLALRLEPASGDLVLKISPDPFDASLEREFEVLRCFSRLTSLIVPEPCLVDISGALLPGSFIAMSRIPGTVMHEVHGMLGPAERRAATDQIAEAVVALHSRTGKGFGGVELEPGERTSWPDFWIPRFERVLASVSESGLMPEPFLDNVREASLRFPRLLDIGEESTLTHYDIWSGNVIIDLNGGVPRVTGYIDVPGYWADYARELSFMEMFGVADRRFYEIYTAAHPLDEGWELRKNIYNLKMHLAHVTMYPGERFYREGAQACLAFIEDRL
jgi:fructosamine-3-kinase